MATEFKDIPFNGEQYFLTSRATSVKASTDQKKVSVALMCESGLNGETETFFSTVLYPFNGEVELSDVGSIIEDYFRDRHKVASMVTIQFDAVSVDALFLYCEYDMPDVFDPAATFFLSSMAQHVHQDSIITIAACDHGSDSEFIIKAVGHLEDSEELGVFTKSVSRILDNEYSTRFEVCQIIGWAIAPDNDGITLRDVLYFSIEYGGIQKTFFIMPSPAYLTFSFRNIFNVEEYIDIEGVLKTKSEVLRETAICKGVTQFYDRKVSRSYEIQTIVSSADVPMYEQFLVSHDVKLYLEGNEWDVVISDFTCEPSSEDDELTTISFIWIFANSRPRMFDTDFNGIIPSRRRIFDYNFSPEYE